MRSEVSRWRSLGSQTLLATWAVLSLLPLVWMLCASLQSNQEIYAGLRFLPKIPHWENYAKAWQMSSFGNYFLNSLFYTAAAVVGVLLFGSMAAFGFASLKIPGKEFFYYLFVFVLMLPVPGQFIPLYLVLIKLGLANTRIGYILILINQSLPLAIFLLRGFIESIPNQLEESARIDGAGTFTIYWRIIIPLCRPALATVTIFSALAAWNELLLALICFSKQELLPVQAGLMIFQGVYLTRFDLMLAATVITTLPVIVIYVLVQRLIIQGVMGGAIKG